MSNRWRALQLLIQRRWRRRRLLSEGGEGKTDVAGHGAAAEGTPFRMSQVARGQFLQPPKPSIALIFRNFAQFQRVHVQKQTYNTSVCFPLCKKHIQSCYEIDNLQFVEPLGPCLLSLSSLALQLRARVSREKERDLKVWLHLLSLLLTIMLIMVNVIMLT